MRFSVFSLLDHYPSLSESLEEVQRFGVRHACLAEELGFRGFWLAEHHLHRLGTVPNPAVLLAAISQRTQKILLGPAVAVLPLRSPVQVIEDYSLVHSISGGRLRLGVGAGSRPEEFEPFQRDFQDRHRDFEASLEFMVGDLGREFTDSSYVNTYRIGGVPIFIASSNERRAFYAGLRGLGLLTIVSPNSQSLSGLGNLIRAYDQGRARAHPKSGKREVVTVLFAHLADTEIEAKNTAGPALDRFLNLIQPESEPDGWNAYAALQQNGTGIVGGVHHFPAVVRNLQSLGVDEVAFAFRFGGMDRELAEASLRLLAAAARAYANQAFVG